MRRFLAFALSGLAIFMTASLSAAQAPQPSVVLVHGAVMDGSSWRGVYNRLRRAGLKVAVVQLPLKSVADDIATTRRVLEQQPGPVVLVGHSYGGVVISAAADDPKVISLVYVAAFQPEAGESVAELSARFPMPTHAKMIDASTMVVDPAHFRADVGADIPQGQTDFLAAAQVPTALALFTTKLSKVGWHAKRLFAVVATDDMTISPDLQRFMYRRSNAIVTSVKSSHLAMLSKPEVVASVILRAARR